MCVNHDKVRHFVALAAAATVLMAVGCQREGGTVDEARRAEGVVTACTR
jgi:hypothetical protein